MTKRLYPTQCSKCNEEFLRKPNESSTCPKCRELALFQDIEELQKWYDGLLAEFKKLKMERVIYIEEAKKQERDRMEALFERLLLIACNGDYSNGVEAFGVDEGRVRAHEALDEIEKDWLAIKKE